MRNLRFDKICSRIHKNGLTYKFCTFWNGISIAIYWFSQICAFLICIDAVVQNICAIFFESDSMSCIMLCNFLLAQFAIFRILDGYKWCAKICNAATFFSPTWSIPQKIHFKDKWPTGKNCHHNIKPLNGLKRRLGATNFQKSMTMGSSRYFLKHLCIYLSKDLYSRRFQLI